MARPHHRNLCPGVPEARRGGKPQLGFGSITVLDRLGFRRGSIEDEDREGQCRKLGRELQKDVYHPAFTFCSRPEIRIIGLASVTLSHERMWAATALARSGEGLRG
jgi:hypothetical protein